MKIRIPSVSVLSMLLLAVQAQAQPDSWLISVGGDLDDEDGYRADLGLSWSPDELTALSASIGYGDSSTDVADFKTTSYALGLDRFFGRWGFTAHAGLRDDEALVSAQSFGGSLYFRSEGWRLALSAAHRSSEFDPFLFNTTIPARVGLQIVQVPVSGRADCSLGNTSFGLSLRRSNAAWSVSAAAVGYDYGANDCDLSDVVIPPQVDEFPRLSREVFRRIAARVLNVGSQRLGSRLTRENSFLESSLSVGVGYQPGRRQYRLEYFHDTEEFAGLKSDTLMASMVLPSGGRHDLELRLGATDSDALGDVLFAGATLYFYLGGAR